MAHQNVSHTYACRRLIRFIRQNCGTTADWPMEISFDDDAVEEDFQQIWSDFVRETNEASPIFPHLSHWEGGASDPDSSVSLHD